MHRESRTYSTVTLKPCIWRTKMLLTKIKTFVSLRQLRLRSDSKSLQTKRKRAREMTNSVKPSPPQTHLLFFFSGANRAGSCRRTWRKNQPWHMSHVTREKNVRSNRMQQSTHKHLTHTGGERKTRAELTRNAPPHHLPLERVFECVRSSRARDSERGTCVVGASPPSPTTFRRSRTQTVLRRRALRRITFLGSKTGIHETLRILMGPRDFWAQGGGGFKGVVLWFFWGGSIG